MSHATVDAGSTEQTTDPLDSKPGIGLARRATVLVAVGGRGLNAADRLDPATPGARLALVGTRSGFAAGMTGGPQIALEAAADQALGGPPTTEEQVKRYRMALLAGNAGLIATGVLAQRVLNHNTSGGAANQVSGAVARQLTIGAAAATIILASDTVLGPLARRQQDSTAASILLRTATRRGQSAALRKMAGVLTLPTKPDPFSYVG